MGWVNSEKNFEITSVYVILNFNLVTEQKINWTNQLNKTSKIHNFLFYTFKVSITE